MACCRWGWVATQPGAWALFSLDTRLAGEGRSSRTSGGGTNSSGPAAQALAPAAAAPAPALLPPGTNWTQLQENRLLATKLGVVKIMVGAQRRALWRLGSKKRVPLLYRCSDLPGRSVVGDRGCWVF